MARSEAIKLRGKPGSLSGVLPGRAGARRASVELKVPGSKTPRRLDAELVPLADGDLTQVFVRAPRSLAPGEYSGSLAVGDDDFLVTAEVFRRPHARLIPKRLEATTAPGCTLDICLNVVNDGNVALTIPGKGHIDLFDARSFERLEEGALLTTLGFVEPSERLKAISGDAYAGRASVAIKGGGDLDPAEARTIDARVKLPKELDPKCAYAGSIELASRNFTLTLHAADSH